MLIKILSWINVSSPSYLVWIDWNFHQHLFGIRECGQNLLNNSSKLFCSVFQDDFVFIFLLGTLQFFGNKGIFWWPCSPLTHCSVITASSVMFAVQFCHVIRRCVTAGNRGAPIGSAQDSWADLATSAIKKQSRRDSLQHDAMDCHFSPAFIQAFNIHQENSVQVTGGGYADPIIFSSTFKAIRSQCFSRATPGPPRLTPEWNQMKHERWAWESKQGVVFERCCCWRWLLQGHAPPQIEYLSSALSLSCI